MAVTVEDILHLDVMSNFKVVAGIKGLSKEVKTVEMLDFEFLEEGEEYRSESFIGESIVLSSLLFAKNNPDAVLEAIKKLMNFDVRALAYKPVFFKELPKEALDYAEKYNFPILEFGKDEFFEDIIFAVNELSKIDESIEYIEPLVDDLIRKKFDKENASKACEKINPLFRPFAACVFIKVEDEGRIDEIIKRAKVSSRMKSKTFVGKYRAYFIIILSQDENNRDGFKVIFDDVIATYGISQENVNMGVSRIRKIGEGFDKTIKEAYWACRVSQIEKKDVSFYDSLGTYKLITSNIEDESSTEYMEDYLKPLLEDEDKDGELFKTALSYVACKGDMAQTAEEMFCHKNTIRYRIGKLQERLDADSNEKEFYENLSMAIKIYLLKQ